MVHKHVNGIGAAGLILTPQYGEMRSVEQDRTSINSKQYCAVVATTGQGFHTWVDHAHVIK